MRKYIIAASALLAVVAIVVLADGIRRFRGVLSPYNEVPALSSTANGTFHAEVSSDESQITYSLSYSDLEGTVQQAHIHFGQTGVNGGVAVWLCSNLASPPTPAGVQHCPAPPATITGTITAANVVGPASQGLEPGEFADLVAAIRAGRTYANVHSSKFPAGEMRAQLRPGDKEHQQDDDH